MDTVIQQNIPFITQNGLGFFSAGDQGIEVIIFDVPMPNVKYSTAHIADNVAIGANAVVYQDMPPHSVALCAPTRIVRKENLDNAFRVKINGVNCVSRDGRLVRE